MAQIIDDDTGLFVAYGAAGVGIGATNLALDDVEPGDALQHLGGNGRFVG